MPEFLMAVLIAAGICAYLLVPTLGPQLLIWSFPGSTHEAQSALADAERCKAVPVVLKAAAAAMAEEMPRAGLWVLSTLPRWSWSAFWPLWLPGSVRGTVRSAVIAKAYAEGRLDG